MVLHVHGVDVYLAVTDGRQTDRVLCKKKKKKKTNMTSAFFGVGGGGGGGESAGIAQRKEHSPSINVD